MVEHAARVKAQANKLEFWQKHNKTEPEIKEWCDGCGCTWFSGNLDVRHDWTDADWLVAALLPCVCQAEEDNLPKDHLVDCPAFYRPAVNQQLAAARVEGARRLQCALEDHWRALCEDQKELINAEIAAMERKP